VRCLADASFDAFRAAVQAALPPGTWLEPDDPDDDSEGPPPGALQIRCVRRKCVKSVKRMTAKVEEAQGKADKSGDVWPFTATIGDALRASVTAPDAAGIRRAWDCIRENMHVIRLKNKFRTAASRLERSDDGAVTSELKAKERTEFPNLHINVLFRAGDGFAPIVAEVQIHHERVLAVSKQDHKLYEVVRAKSMAAVAAGKGGGETVLIQKEKATDREKALEDDVEQLRAENAALRAAAAPAGGAGINAARSLR